MTGDLTISVALCTHNGEKFLEEQLLSILNQTMRPREIVLSDDASTDGTVRLASSILADHRRSNPELELVLLQNPTPLGVAKNFEQAILASSSDLVALCDQDDTWAPEKLKRMAAVFSARPGLMLLHSDARLIDEAGATLPGTLFSALEVSSEALRAIHTGDAFNALLRRNLVTGATAVIRKKLADIAAPFPEAWLHDEWLAMIASAFGELDVVEDALIAYRQHGTNQIGAVKLSFAGKFGRMVEPGTLRNRRLLARATSLADRFEAMRGRVSAPQLAAVRDKLRHEQVRASLPSSRLRRVVPVLRELTTGRYASYGRGVSDAVRDLSQSLNPAR